MQQRILLIKFKELRDYTNCKHKLNDIILKTYNHPEFSTYREDLIELGDMLDNLFDKSYLMLHRGL